jgi:hypothetical protein
MPQIYQAYIPKVIRSCTEELSQNDWKLIGKTASIFKLNLVIQRDTGKIETSHRLFRGQNRE